MTGTRAEISDILVGRATGLIVVTGVSADPAADASPRAYTDDPIAYAVRKSGGSTASLLAATDAEIAAVETGKEDQVLDIAELRFLDNLIGRWTKANQSRGPITQSLGDLGKFYQDRADSLREKVKEVYAVDASTPTVISTTASFSDVPSGSAASAAQTYYF